MKEPNKPKLKGKQQESPEYSAFSAALSKVLKVSHEEMVKRIKLAKSTPKRA